MSDLTRIQDEILKRFRRPRTAAGDVPLGDQIDSDAGMTANGARDAALQRGREDINAALQRRGTSPDRMSGVASRSIFAPPQSQQPVPVDRDAPPPVPASPNARSSDEVNYPTQRSVFAPPRDAGMIDSRNPADYPNKTPPPVSMSRDRRTQPRDYVADDAQYLRDLEDKPRTWKDKGVDALRAVNQSLGSNPNIFTPTNKEREVLKAQGMLGRDIAIQKEQTAQQMAQMVPIYDAAGNVISMAPRKTAAGTQIRATDTSTRAGETKRRNDAYIADIERRPKKEQAEAARKIYQSGVADGDDEFKATLAQRMGLQEKLPDSDKGTVQTDANGNFTIVHPRTATAETVTDKTTGNPAGSWSAAQFRQAEEGRNKRAEERRKQSERNATIMAGGQVARMGDPTIHQKNIAEIDQDMASADSEISGILARQKSEGFLPTDAATLNQLRQRKNILERERRGEREKLGKIESSQGNLQQRGGGTTPRTFNEKAFKAKFQEKHKRQPTEDEIAPYRNARP